MWQLSVLVTPAAKERIGEESTVVRLVHQAQKELEQRSFVPRDPMSTTLRERGTVTRRISSQLVDALVGGKQDESLCQIDIHKASGIAPPKEASTDPPRRIPEPSDDISSRVCLCGIVEPQRGSARLAEATEGRQLPRSSNGRQRGQELADQDPPRRRSVSFAQTQMGWHY